GLTSTTYDAGDNVVAQTTGLSVNPALPADPATETAVFNALEEEVSAIGADGDVVTCVYDAARNALSQTAGQSVNPALPAHAETSSSTYNLRDQPVSQTAATGAEVTLVYDRGGNRVGETDGLSINPALPAHVEISTLVYDAADEETADAEPPDGT